MKKFGNFSNLFVGLLLLIAGLYFLYSKGIILANFERVKPAVAYEMIKKDPDIVVLDVRTDQEYRQDGHLKGAKLIPLQDLEERLGELEPYKKREILVYCRSGHRSVKASRLLADRGFKPLNIDGGIIGWRDAALPILK